MRFVLAPDSFKESMTARAAALAMRAGVLRVFPDADCVLAPLADGGEGTVEALLAATGGTAVTRRVTGPLGRPVDAVFGYVAADHLAIIEVAAAVGLGLVEPAARDPRHATTAGVGQLIRHALDLGARRFIVGLGGTGTNDAGAGMLQALGASLVDAAGGELPPGGAALARLASIDLAGLDPRLRTARFEIASDVCNPLLGTDGASQVFGPQKGASPAVVVELDAALGVFAEVVRERLGLEIALLPGAGAAGGLGAALLGVLGAGLDRGIDVVIRATGLSERIIGADAVFTGEGSLDAQTLLGKAPLGVAQLAARHGVPVVAFGGRLGEGAQSLVEHGFSAVVPIVGGVCDLSTALRDGPRNLERAVEMVCRLIRIPS